MAKERRVKTGGAGGKILCLFLGLLMGIIFVVGGLAGVGFYVYKQPIDKTIKTVDKFVPSDLYAKIFGADGKTGILNEKYATEKVGTLLKDTAKAISALTGDGSLSKLNEISPKVGDTVNKVLKTTNKYEIPLTEEGILNTPVNDLGDYLSKQLKETPVSGLLKGFNDGKDTEDSILRALCYGEEGVDYTYDADGNIVMLGEAKATTLNELLSGSGVSDQIDKMPLEAIDIDMNDAIMRTLAYGSAERYDVEKDEEGKIVNIIMKQVSFSWDGAKMYDVDGNEIKGNFDIDALVFTVEGGSEIYYLDENPVAVATAEAEPTPPATPTRTTYYAYTSADKQEAALYKKKKIVDLTQNSASLVDSLYLSDALNVNDKSHKVLISLAYGNEGEGYTVNEDGTIQLKDGVKPRTIGELKSENEELINGIQLKDALNITASSHKVLLSIAYGNEGEHYTIEDGKFEMIGDNKPRTLADLSGTKGTDTINGIRLSDALNITPSSHRVLISIAYGHEGENYDIVNGEIKPRTGDENKPRTLADLSGDKSSEIINGIYLADALNITPTSDNVLITLAYGKAGRDYTIEGDKFVMKEGKKPRALSDLQGDIGSLLDDITLADVMDPDFKSPIIMYLLYGREGIHYKKEVKDGKEVAVPLQQRIAVAEIGGEWKAFNPYGEELTGTFNGGKLVRTLDYANHTYTVKVTEGEGEEATITTTVYKFVDLPSGVTPTTLTLKDGTVATYYYLTDQADNAVYYEGTTLGDLSGENNTISMLTKRLTLGELLGEDSVNDNIFLKHVKDETIDTLPDAIEKLKITDVYAEDIFKTVEVTEGGVKVTYFVDGAGNKIAKVDAELTQEQKNQRVVVGTWKYLLKDKDTGVITEYPVTEIGKLVGNMTTNMQKASLQELSDDQIISGLDQTTLDKKIKTQIGAIDLTASPYNYTLPSRTDGSGDPKEFVKELTVSELFAYVSVILTA